jgi:hypothetical protein
VSTRHIAKEKDLRSSLSRRHVRTAKRNKTAEDFILFPLDGSAIYLNSFLPNSKILQVINVLVFFLMVKYYLRQMQLIFVFGLRRSFMNMAGPDASSIISSQFAM